MNAAAPRACVRARTHGWLQGTMRARAVPCLQWRPQRAGTPKLRRHQNPSSLQATRSCQRRSCCKAPGQRNNSLNGPPIFGIVLHASDEDREMFVRPAKERVARWFDLI